jgi:hypothetical protein
MYVICIYSLMYVVDSNDHATSHQCKFRGSYCWLRAWGLTDKWPTWIVKTSPASVVTALLNEPKCCCKYKNCQFRTGWQRRQSQGCTSERSAKNCSPKTAKMKIKTSPMSCKEHFNINQARQPNQNMMYRILINIGSTTLCSMLLCWKY